MENRGIWRELQEKKPFVLILPYEQMVEYMRTQKGPFTKYEGPPLGLDISEFKPPETEIPSL